ncbi:SorU family sulfite dehydrogenase c-type cytochrome subunit [Zobellella iuensis]|uniref:Cytochrome c n=1 Tax=Zobellella iuensis TaxID=2803811 RepID=A0ABS1QM53_9GAMM|nr:cytochrome c [Zobellella iuensis]MBL1375938.1 cytochrome c [Zobellella iuensis]
MWRPTASLLGLALCLPALAEGDPEAGKRVFLELAQPSCALCHSLKDAGAEGQIGPSLDELKPTEAQVVQAVTNGVGIMPAFKDSLSPEQIAALAQYVSQAVRP